MEKRYTVKVIPRNAMSDAQVQVLEEALNDPTHADHGLEAMYATESNTVIVWRTAI